MISFIIIGRNEGWKISKCIESVYKTIKFNLIYNYEIIYVDSNSTDDSISRIKKFSEVKIIMLVTDFNSAIARNVGAKESRGNILYFIDGDMEIQESFLSLIFKNGEIVYPFISGQYINYFYDKNNELIKMNIYDKSIQNEDKYKVVTGGLFVIERKYWELVGGMREVYKRSQDIDLGLRLAKRGMKLLRKKELMAIHHTVSYRDKDRMWKMLLNTNAELYGKSLLYRNHIFNKYIYSIIIRNDYSLVFLIFSIIISIYLNPFFLFLYFFVIFIRAIKSSKQDFLSFINLFFYFFIRDIKVLVGFFFFFPKKKFNINYKYI